MSILDKILAIVQARLVAARQKIAEYEAAKAAQQSPTTETDPNV